MSHRYRYDSYGMIHTVTHTMIQRLTESMFAKAGCDLSDMACMRAMTTEEVQAASQTGAMNNDNVAMVLNGAFGPTHRSDLMPETLFDAVKNVSDVIVT